jgi:beta-glucosidase-like glycosyl hydrolase
MLVFFASMCAAVRPQEKGIPRLEELSLDEKIGQMFSVGARGVFMGESSVAYQQLLHHVRDNHVGGFIWFVSNVYETALLNDKLQHEARVPLLISADLEAGMGMRFADTTFWPSAMAVAATGDPALAEQEGRVVAREARALGVNHILAPVADVNVDPDNPVINTRSFGEDPTDVSRYVTAFTRGVQSERVIACAKHFPGHGDTHVDSHRTLPVLDVTRERLERVELVPFRAAIAANVESVMMGHLSVPALDPTPVPLRALQPGENLYGTRAEEMTRNGTMPATISRPIIEGLLRRELGYDRLVVSDAFDMGGLTEHFDPGEAGVRAIEAGEDQILLSPDTDAAIAAVKAAVKSGRIPEARIDASVRRILTAKQFAGAPPADPQRIFRIIDSKEHRDVAGEIARRALTLVREQSGVLPLRPDVNAAVVFVSDFPEAATPLADFEREIRRTLKSPPQVALIDPRSREGDISAIGSNADVIILALAVRARSGAGQIAVPPAVRQLVEALGSKPIVAISFGTPYLLRDIPTVGTYICAYGIQPVMQVAAISAIFGETAFSGRLPVTIRGLYPRGHGLQRLDSAHSAR